MSLLVPSIWSSLFDQVVVSLGKLRSIQPSCHKPRHRCACIERNHFVNGVEKNPNRLHVTTNQENQVLMQVLSAALSHLVVPASPYFQASTAGGVRKPRMAVEIVDQCTIVSGCRSRETTLNRGVGVYRNFSRWTLLNQPTLSYAVQSLLALLTSILHA